MKKHSKINTMTTRTTNGCGYSSHVVTVDLVPSRANPPGGANMLQPHFFLIQVSLQFFSGTLQKSFEIFTNPGGCWVPDCRIVASGSISLPRLWVFGLPAELLESLVPKQAAALGAELRLKQDPQFFFGRLSWWQASNEPRDHLVEAFEDLDVTCKN